VAETLEQQTQGAGPHGASMLEKDQGLKAHVRAGMGNITLWCP